MSKKCAVCGKPLESGVVVHSECMPRWIPVTERLPKPLECVLTHRQFDPFYKGLMSVACFSGTFMANGKRLRHVTHWMPLPEPPEVE